MANRVAIYLRVSTQDQATELQQRELTAYVQARGWVVFKTYEDKATGTTANRAMLKAMLTDARLRRFDRIIVWKLDRFARSLKDLVTMLQELSELGIEFISLRDNIDLTTSSGRLMMHMIGAFAEFEASIIRERVRAGIANARAKGKRLGRPKTRDDGTIKALRRQGLSIRSIALQAHCSAGAVQRALLS
ncbi:MAG TPA: resolvase [Bdellovibrionales bacterium]|nr:MAG: hypothetical protein A2Z97_16155 [Bdellovibrionales bacterium GWB1_52_6]OFZ05053.1 MAG: hypothetical protein A2X97_00475 [Bdellovibrionales bacterium GWA1_52_35]OFZ37248.1 MAG: hypothetical protein A2070_07115 [Bdellovibrionales bacterium GWC1_52_8]HAR41982.1 resolvase [Bdellovibrionales bacterium]HCM41289.1 resolvase [Bdellovibrionales bacterium]